MAFFFLQQQKIVDIHFQTATAHLSVLQEKKITSFAPACMPGLEIGPVRKKTSVNFFTTNLGDAQFCQTNQPIFIVLLPEELLTPFSVQSRLGSKTRWPFVCDPGLFRSAGSFEAWCCWELVEGASSFVHATGLDVFNVLVHDTSMLLYQHE